MPRKYGKRERKLVITARRAINWLKGIGWLRSLIPYINATIHSVIRSGRVECIKADSLSPLPLFLSINKKEKSSLRGKDNRIRSRNRREELLLT